jgi:integrase
MLSNLLTDRECKNSKCPHGKKVVKLSDGRGMQLWVMPNGSKYWRLRYWTGSKEKLLALGVYPHITLSEARRKREEAQHQRALGVDPGEKRRDDRLEALAAAECSFEVVAREWFDRKSKGSWVPSHAEDMKRRLENDLLPVLGSRRIDKITASEVREAIARMESRGAFDLCRRVLQMATQVFRYGMAMEKCTYDPTVGLNKILTRQVVRNMPSLPTRDLPALMVAIAGYESIGDRQTRIGLHLLAHCFTRTGELINAKWEEFDIDGAVWSIPAERMKEKRPHLVPLSKQVITLLEELKPLTGYSKFILPGRNFAKPISNNTLLFALYRMGYKSRMSGHGFRSVASTVLNESGQWSGDAIELQLSHAERNQVRGAYNRAQRIEERTRMMQWWSGYLDGLTKNSKGKSKRKSKR